MFRNFRDALRRRRGAWLSPLIVAALFLAMIVWNRESRRASERTALPRSERLAQREPIRPTLPEQAPFVVAHDEVVRTLWRSFREWRPAADAAAVEPALAAARRRLEDANAQNNFPALIAAVVAAPQISWTLNQALAEGEHHFTEWSDSQALTRRMRQLAGETVSTPLNVEVYLIIHDVSIPDAGRDEIRLDLGIHSGAPPEALARFMVENAMLAADQARGVLERWKRTDSRIGDTEKERENLAACLTVLPRERMETREREVSYNYGPASKRVWRNAELTVIAPARFDTAQYPFDRSLFTVLLLSSWDDVSQVALLPYERGVAPLDPRKTRPPRGFYFSRQSTTLTPAAFQDDTNSLAEPALAYVFELNRRLTTAVWHTFMPLLLIAAFGFFAALRAMATGENVSTVMTSLLPTLTVAGVALQLNASAAIPSNGGGTVMDKIFISSYVQLFSLFLALNLLHKMHLSRAMVAVSFAAFCYGLHFFF